MADVQIPKEVPRWMYEAFMQLAQRADTAGSQIAAIGRGESPDGSGSALIDTSVFFFLPGLPGGQTAIQVDYSSPLLTMTQSVATAGAEPLLLLDSFGKLLRLKTQSFTVAACTTTVGQAEVSTTGSFIQGLGPTVVPGMLISGAGIPANTYVVRLTSGQTLFMTQNATASGSSTVCTFTTQVDVQPRTDETGRDIEWLVRGAIRFTPGTDNIPFRIVGDQAVIASGISLAPRVYLETGYLLSGAAIGTDFQIGGPGHGELSHMNIFSRTLWLTRSPASGTNNIVGFGSENPATYGAGFGPTASLLVGGEGRPVVISGVTGNWLEFRSASTGTSPNKVLGALNMAIGLSGGDKSALIGYVAGTEAMRLQPLGSANLQWAFLTAAGIAQLGHTTVPASWADAIAGNTTRIEFGDLSSGFRAAAITSTGGNILTRLGISSSGTTIENTTLGGGAAGLSAPLGILYVVNNATNGSNFITLLNVQSKRTGQVSNLFVVSSAVAGSATFTVDKQAFLQAEMKSTGFFVDATDLTKKMNLVLSGITTATTRSLTVGNWAGKIAAPVGDGTSAQVLTSNGAGVQPSWQAAGAGAHALLSATHSDTVAQTVSRGSLIYGNSTPAWDELVIGGASTLLKSDGTDASWGTVNLLSAFHADTTAGTVVRGDLITGQAATPKWQRLAKGAANQVLKMDASATDIVWGDAGGAAGGGGQKFLWFHPRIWNGDLTSTTRGGADDTVYEGISLSGVLDRDLVATFIVPQGYSSIAGINFFYSNTGATGGSTTTQIGFDIMNDGDQADSSVTFGSVTTYTCPAVTDEIDIVSLAIPSLTLAAGNIVRVILRRYALAEAGDTNTDLIFFLGLKIEFTLA